MNQQGVQTAGDGRLYRKPTLVDRGAVESRTRDHSGSVDPEMEDSDNIVWGQYTPEASPGE